MQNEDAKHRIRSNYVVEKITNIPNFQLADLMGVIGVDTTGVQALPSSPSSAGLVPFSSASVFFLALSGFARSGPGVLCWCLLFPSSFVFPSSRPG